MHGNGENSVIRILIVSVILASAVILCWIAVLQKSACEMVDGFHVSPNSYTTQFRVQNRNNNPSFSFSYPPGWSVSSEFGEAFDKAVIRKVGTNLSIRFIYADELGEPNRIHPKSIIKISESNFWPFYVHRENLSGIGPFAIAAVTLETDGADGDKNESVFYAILPERAITNVACEGLVEDQGFPAFEYGRLLSFACEIPKEGITYEERREVLRILASFSNGVSEQQYERAHLAWLASPWEY